MLSTVWPHAYRVFMFKHKQVYDKTNVLFRAELEGTVRSLLAGLKLSIAKLLAAISNEVVANLRFGCIMVSVKNV